MSEPLTREQLEALEKSTAWQRDLIAELRGERDTLEQANLLAIADRYAAQTERNAARARCEQLEQLYSHKDLDFECAESGCKSKKLTDRCEQFEHANGDLLGHLERSNREIETLRARCRNWESLYAVKEKRCEQLEAERNEALAITNKAHLKICRLEEQLDHCAGE